MIINYSHVSAVQFSSISPLCCIVSKAISYSTRHVNTSPLWSRNFCRRTLRPNNASCVERPSWNRIVCHPGLFYTLVLSEYGILKEMSLTRGSLDFFYFNHSSGISPDFQILLNSFTTKSMELYVGLQISCCKPCSTSDATTSPSRSFLVALLLALISSKSWVT